MQTYKTSKAKENILSKIRKELGESQTPMPYPEAEKSGVPLYAWPIEEREEAFVAAFAKLGGKFVFCDNEAELMQNLLLLKESRGWGNMLCADQRLLKLFQNNKITDVVAADAKLEAAEVCITGCELLVARTGSVMVSSRLHLGRMSSVYFPVHIVFAYANQIVADIEDAFVAMRKKYGTDLPSMMNLITGPSRTADIEKTLVVGVHGPAEVFCFYINADL